MTISRYKIMAGILGVSIGGLAAVAGQCPRPTTHRSDAPPGDPKVPNAGSKPSMLPAVPSIDLPPPAATPASPVGVDLPALPVPSLPAVPASTPSKLPELPPVTPVKAEAPKTPAIPTPVVIPASGNTLPEVPPALPAVAVPEKAPTLAPATPPVPKTAPTAVVPSAPTIEPISASPATAPATLIPAPAATSPVATPPAAVPPTSVIDPAPATRPAPAQAVQAVPAANRFRILLRVGEGEPMFEVKSGDDLVMRVVCEKVDIKSPDKGTGPSSVIATGKVRFVGFGAEGSCESLSFLAGTGEVAMSGSVRVQVKDKIGRVESELTSDRLQYRLDAANLPGVMRP